MSGGIESEADVDTLPSSALRFLVEQSGNPVGRTTALVRSRLSKESLQQRLLEIAQETLYHDKRLNELLEAPGYGSLFPNHRILQCPAPNQQPSFYHSCPSSIFPSAPRRRVSIAVGIKQRGID